MKQRFAGRVWGKRIGITLLLLSVAVLVEGDDRSSIVGDRTHAIQTRDMQWLRRWL